jgi:hypothetical protein
MEDVIGFIWLRIWTVFQAFSVRAVNLRASIGFSSGLYSVELISYL